VTGLPFGFRLSFRIGRQDDCEVCSKNDYGSRDQAEMVFEGGAWWVRELGSAIRIDAGGFL
jgi:pSer/pThr/pTyr-binding forkhead associated (FHA) protein